MSKASLKLVISNSVGNGLEPFCKFLLLKHGLKHNTINNHRKCIARFQNSIGDDCECSAAVVEDYIASMYLADKYSYWHLTNTIRILERYMEFLGTPISLGRPRKPKRISKDALSEAEIAVMIALSKNLREKAMLCVLAYSGIRNEELCCLKVKDVDFSSNTLFVNQGKGSKDRVVPITGDCIKVIMQYLAAYPRPGSSFLFTTLRQSEQYTGWALRRFIKKMARRAKIEKRISPHTFRRSLASNMSGRGADIQFIKDMLGHSSVETTMLYISSDSRRTQASYLRYAPNYV